MENKLEAELVLVEQFNNRSLLELGKHYFKVERFNYGNLPENADEYFYEYKVYHTLNLHREKFGFPKVDDADYIIEHGLLLTFYLNQKLQIMQKMQGGDKEEELKKFHINLQE